MSLDEMIAVLQAAKAGKVIEHKLHYRDEAWNMWTSTPAPTWNFASCDYRVKPEPREWRVWVDPTGVISQFGNHSNTGVAVQIKVREVLE